MTWAEFLIRLHSFKRMDHRETMRLRELSWITYIAPHQNPKRMKKSIQAFWPINKPKPLTTDLMRERIKAAQEKYQKELKEKENG